MSNNPNHTSLEEKPCWLYVDGEPCSYNEPMNKMQSKDIDEKKLAVQTCLYSMIVDAVYPDNLMIQAIKYVNTCDDVEIKKVLLLFWEVIEKHKKDDTDEVRSEFLLVYNSIRKDLTSPNEYVRGRTLRLISKLPYYTLFESVKNVVFENLSHKHPYVKKNAIACILNLVKNFGVDILPEDINSQLKEIIEKDSDVSCRRNAYLVLSEVDLIDSLSITRSILSDNNTEISEIGELLMLTIVRNLKKIFKDLTDNNFNISSNNAKEDVNINLEKGKIIKNLLEIKNHKSNAVKLEVANTLLSITGNISVIKQVISIYSNLLIELNDNNLLLIILNKLLKLKERHKVLLEENILSFTVIINSNLSKNIRLLLFKVVSDLINESNIKSVFEILLKQYNKIKNMSSENSNIKEYKYSILNLFYTNIKKYSNIIDENYIIFLLDKLLLLDSDISINTTNNNNNNIENYEDQFSMINDLFYIYRSNSNIIESMINKIFKIFNDICNYNTMLVVLYLISENCSKDKNKIIQAFNLISKSLGDLNFDLINESTYEDNENNKEEAKKPNKKYITKTIIREDGTYGTTTEEVNFNDDKNKENLFLREAILNNNYFFASNLVVAITKLVLNLSKLIDENNNCSKDVDQKNLVYFNSIEIICSILKLNSNKVYKDSNNLNRISMCLEFLMENNYNDFLNFAIESKEIFNNLSLNNNNNINNNKNKNRKKTNNLINNDNGNNNNVANDLFIANKPGDFINFRHIIPYNNENTNFIESDNSNEEEELEKRNLEALLCNSNLTLNNNYNSTTNTNTTSKSIDKKIFTINLTGIEDELQVEANIEIFTFDIIIEFIVRNKTKMDFQNVTIDLYAPTNLDIIEKAPSFNLSAKSDIKVKSCIKFSSSCNSFVFGEISYSNFRGTVNFINLSGIFINLLNTYAAPCSENNFRKCWLLYNWEHKVMLISKIKTFKEIINYLCFNLNLKLVYPFDVDNIDEESVFLVSNLYTCSKLGEDALINISIEKSNDKKIIGTAIIRSKVKEFATFLGEKIKSLIK